MGPPFRLYALLIPSTSPDPFAFHYPPPPAPSAAEDDNDEFELIHVVSAALSTADEIFSSGKLMPLLHVVPVSALCSPPPCLEEVEPASKPMSPHVPRCVGQRWRDLLHLVSSSKKANDGNKCGDGCLKLWDMHFRPLLSWESSSFSRSTPAITCASLHRRRVNHSGHTLRWWRTSSLSTRSIPNKIGATVDAALHISISDRSRHARRHWCLEGISKAYGLTGGRHLSQDGKLRGGQNHLKPVKIGGQWLIIPCLYSLMVKDSWFLNSMAKTKPTWKLDGQKWTFFLF